MIIVVTLSLRTSGPEGCGIPYVLCLEIEQSQLSFFIASVLVNAFSHAALTHTLVIDL